MNPERADLEPEVRPEEPEAPATKGLRAFSRLRREVSEEELTSPGAVRLLLAHLDRTDEQVAELAGYRDRFYQADKERAILQERLKTKIAAEIIFATCLTVGAALIGFSPGLWSTAPYGWISIILGSLLIAGGVVSRLFIRL